MKNVFVLVIISVVLLSNCAPTRKTIEWDKAGKPTWINQQLKGKFVSLRLSDGTFVAPVAVHFNRDSVRYQTENGREQTIAITRLRSLTAKPKLSTATLIGVPLVGWGLYAVTTSDNINGWGAFGKLYLGAVSLGLGGVILIFGSKTAATTYRFN